MTDVEQLRALKKRAEDSLKTLEKKRLAGDISEAEYRAWQREFTSHTEKISLLLEEKGVPKDAEKPSNVESRLQVYIDPKVQALLKSLVDGSIQRIFPVFDWTYGDRYQPVEEVSGLTPYEVKPLLEKLFESGILQREFHDSYVKCAKCNSLRIRLKFQCSSCGSPNLTKGDITEHLKCGYANFSYHFKPKNDSVVCPKCGEVLKQIGVDYQKPGTWYKCQACGAFSGSPSIKHYCEACSSAFDRNEAVLEGVYSYKLSPLVRREVESTLLVVTPLKDYLARIGWRVESPGIVTGFSGTKHQFMIVITETSGGEVRPIVTDVCYAENKVDASQVLGFFAKACDVDSSARLLIGVPGFDDDARKIASNYGITALEVSDRKQISETLTKTFESIAKVNPQDVRREIAALRSAMEAEESV